MSASRKEWEDGLPTPSPVLRATLTEQAYREIKRRILADELRPGERLNEKQLATAIGVSPTPVREAINKLGGDGLITYSAWQGATVVDLQPADISHLYDIRCALERLAVEEAAANLRPEDPDFLEALLAETEPAIARGEGGLQHIHHINTTFHHFFQDRSGNPWLRDMMAGLEDLLILARRPLSTRRNGQEALREHRAVVAALRAGNARGAADAMEAHIERVKRDLLDYLRETRIP